jgi:hypothetical protein
MAALFGVVHDFKPSRRSSGHDSRVAQQREVTDIHVEQVQAGDVLHFSSSGGAGGPPRICRVLSVDSPRKHAHVTLSLEYVRDGRHLVSDYAQGTTVHRVRYYDDGS